MQQLQKPDPNWLPLANAPFSMLQANPGLRQWYLDGLRIKDLAAIWDLDRNTIEVELGRLLLCTNHSSCVFSLEDNDDGSILFDFPFWSAQDVLSIAQLPSIFWRDVGHAYFIAKHLWEESQVQPRAYTSCGGVVRNRADGRSPRGLH
jgi:hypothetical protein